MPTAPLERLVRARDLGARAACRATLRLARASLALRREFEGLVLAGHAVARADAAGDLDGGVVARLHRVEALALLSDRARVATWLDDLPPRLAALAPARRERWTPAFLALRAQAHAAAVDPDGVAGLATGWSGVASSTLGWRVRIAGLRVAARRGERAAIAGAAALLDALEANEGADAGPAARRELALVVAAAVRPLEEARPLVRRAHDLAVAAAFERLVELERFVVDFPEAAAPSLEDLEVLEDHRLRARPTHAEFHAAVARRFASAARRGEVPAGALAAEGELTCVCAWCQRVRTHRGVWLSIQHFLPLELEGPIPLTHGICGVCEPSVRSQLEHADLAHG
jgi:hypothetical protein